MKNCHEIKNKLVEYFYGEVRDEEKKRIIEHLASCPYCLKEFKGIKSVLKDVSALERPALDPAFIEKYRVQVKEKLFAGKKSTLGFLRIPAVLTACLVITFAVFSFREEKLTDDELIYAMSTSSEICGEVMDDLDIEVLAEMMEITTEPLDEGTI